MPSVAAARQAAGEDAAGRGAGDQVEHVGRPAARAALDLGQHEGRDQAPDAAAVDREHLHPRAKTREPPDLRPTGFRHAAVTMTHLPKKLLLLGTVACALGAAQPAAAQVQPAGTGEPLYTNSAQNTQWFEWPATSGIDGYRVRFDYYENNALVANPTQNPPQRREQRVGQLVRREEAPARRPVRRLCPGLLLVPQRLAVHPRRPELVLDGHDARPPRLHDDRPLEAERRRSRVAGGAAATKDAKVADPGQLRRRRRRARSRPTSCASSSAARATSATPTPASSTATTPRARCPASGGKSTTFTCTADFGSGNNPAPDGPVWACVIAADAAIPDNPNGPNQSASRRARPTCPTPKCDSVLLDRTAPRSRSSRGPRPRSATSSPSARRPPTPRSGVGRRLRVELR